jgi:hypothetical protein
MPIFISYPLEQMVEDAEIEKQYVRAVEAGVVPLGEGRARTTFEMAQALEDAGLITLKRPFDFSG